MPLRAARWILGLAALLAAANLVRFYIHRATPPVAVPQARPPAGVPAELATRELKILNFYAPRVPERGKPATLCYGVVNAERVELDPPLAGVWPSISRCVEITVGDQTRLTLRAYGRGGQSVSASFVLPVAEPQPEILFAETSAEGLGPDGRYTLCYGVRFASRVLVEPGGTSLPVSEKRCATWFPAKLPRRLVAEGPGGRAIVELDGRKSAPSTHR